MVGRPRTTEDIEELRLRASLRLERRRTGIDGPHLHPGRVVIGRCLPCIREASALVAALDDVLVERETRLAPQYDGRDGSLETSEDEEAAMIAEQDRIIEENMERWAHGDR